MDPKEQWFRYLYAKRSAAALLQEVIMGASENFDDVVDAIEMANLWKLAVGTKELRVGSDTYGQMIEATCNWRVLDV